MGGKPPCDIVKLLETPKALITKVMKKLVTGTEKNCGMVTMLRMIEINHEMGNQQPSPNGGDSFSRSPEPPQNSNKKGGKGEFPPMDAVQRLDGNGHS